MTHRRIRLTAPSPGASLDVLVAEDSIVIRRMTEVLLGELGHRADTVINGREAVEAVAQRPYDVVLMDVHMPVMDGLEATRRICARYHPLERPRIIAFTTNTDEDNRRACSEAGADAFLAKPLRPQDLEAVLAAVFHDPVDAASDLRATR